VVFSIELRDAKYTVPTEMVFFGEMVYSEQAVIEQKYVRSYGGDSYIESTVMLISIS
jgi:hypothetical protein